VPSLLACPATGTSDGTLAVGLRTAIDVNNLLFTAGDPTPKRNEEHAIPRGPAANSYDVREKQSAKARAKEMLNESEEIELDNKNENEIEVKENENENEEDVNKEDGTNNTGTGSTTPYSDEEEDNEEVPEEDITSINRDEEFSADTLELDEERNLQAQATPYSQKIKQTTSGMCKSPHTKDTST
jgi:hypothetical protein